MKKAKVYTLLGEFKIIYENIIIDDEGLKFIINNEIIAWFKKWEYFIRDQEDIDILIKNYSEKMALSVPKRIKF